jgi:hypothetical protein
MKVRAFVILSSLALFSWLTATFVRVVPMHTYGAEGAIQADTEAEALERPVAVVEEK